MIRPGARDLIQRAIAVGVRELFAEYGNVRTLSGILTPVEVRVPKVRDRSGGGVEFNSALVPLCVRRRGGGATLVVSEGSFGAACAQPSAGCWAKERGAA